jgi:hypothetical protein
MIRNILRAVWYCMEYWKISSLTNSLNHCIIYGRLGHVQGTRSRTCRHGRHATFCIPEGQRNDCSRISHILQRFTRVRRIRMWISKLIFVFGEHSERFPHSYSTNIRETTNTNLFGEYTAIPSQEYSTLSLRTSL